MHLKATMVLMHALKESVWKTPNMIRWLSNQLLFLRQLQIAHYHWQLTRFCLLPGKNTLHQCFFSSGPGGHRPAWAFPAPAWLIEMRWSLCGISGAWWRDGQLNPACWDRETSNADFPSPQPAWLHSFVSAQLEIFHHNMATCLKVCLKPITRLPRSLQSYRRISSNRVAPLIQLQTHWIVLSFFHNHPTPPTKSFKSCYYEAALHEVARCEPRSAQLAAVKLVMEKQISAARFDSEQPKLRVEKRHKTCRRGGPPESLSATFQFSFDLMARIL